jgi:hypothetical protein
MATTTTSHRDTIEPVTPDPEAVQHAFKLITGHMVSCAVYNATQLGIPDRLAGGPRTAADLARDCGVNEDALYRLLRALSSVGVFAETAPRTFGLTPPAAALQDGPLRWMALWVANPFNVRVHADSMHSIKTGEPAVRVTTGKDAFEYFAGDQALSKVFNDAMTGFSMTVIPAVVEAYDFSGIGTLVDVAGGHGAVLSAILEKYPAMKGILFDLDHVIAGAKAQLAARGLADRVTTATGDFFTAVPAGDAYVMKHIIHDWNDEKATTILKNIRAVIPSTGRVVLIESIIAEGNEPQLGKIIDLEMLVMPGGKERTADEYRALFAAAGFELTRLVETKSPLNVIEARPR